MSIPNSRATGMAEGTVKSHLFRATQSVREQLRQWVDRWITRRCVMEKACRNQNETLMLDVLGELNDSRMRTEWSSISRRATVVA